MRKTMEVVGLGILAVLFWITYSALNGPEKLPNRIPTHFDISGQPNAWGPPGFLWFLPLVAIGLYLLMTVLGSIRFRRYNLPVAVTESNLPFIQEQTSVMVTWIKCEMLCLFAYLQWSIIQSARTSQFRLSPLLIPVFLVVIFSTVGWHLAAIIRGAKARIDSSDPMMNIGKY
ncbi:DUF1648 domain-containing protein [Telmatobacter sp. DSM 110680]|uniref:DUF1648 domain-containing protein n=1 Tax=Telmatobacter sp. DSM 110680 TaxID=3036704 RepID=A0AAU7DRH9_9BACT